MPSRSLPILSAALLLAATAAAPVTAQTSRSPFATGLKSASMMTPTEIREHNKELTSKDADFIRCRKYPQIGSLVKVSRVCKTNAQWVTSFRQGNDNARDTQDAMTRAPINGGN